MKKVTRRMNSLAFIFLAMIVGSVVVSRSYIEENNIEVNELMAGFSEIDFDSKVDLGEVLTGSSSSSDYETLVHEETFVFELKDDIFVSSSGETITFIEEERSTIQVDYSKRYPDTDLYDHTYSVKEKGDQITISSSLNIRNLIMDKSYESFIRVYIPTGYRFENITIDSTNSSFDSSNIYANAEHVKIHTTHGNLNLELNHPIDNLEVNTTTGTIDLITYQPIKEVEIETTFGDINYTANDVVEDLEINSDLGNIYVEANTNIETTSINTNLGDISGIYKGNSRSVKVNTNNGEITFLFPELKELDVYLESNIGDITSSYNNDDDHDNYQFITNLGNVHVGYE